jgi:copper homeostasis protein CutC
MFVFLEEDCNKKKSFVRKKKSLFYFFRLLSFYLLSKGKKTFTKFMLCFSVLCFFSFTTFSLVTKKINQKFVFLNRVNILHSNKTSSKKKWFSNDLKKNHKQKSRMSLATEICVDSLDAVILAHRAIHIDSSKKSTLRFELCSALHQGGLTPSPGFVQSVIDYFSDDKNNNNNSSSIIITVELYIMIRCRPGLDFVYSANEMQVMEKDVEVFAKLFGNSNLVRGVVFGALKRPGTDSSTTSITKAIGIDLDAVLKICAAIQNHQPKWSMTFHRAIDYLGANATTINLENSEFYYFAKCLQEISQFPQIRYVLTSGGITQNSSEKDGNLAVDFLVNRVFPALVRPDENQRRIGIIVGGGVNKTVIEKVYAAKSKTSGLTKNLFEFAGVHFSGKKVVKPEGVPESESFWSLNEDVVKDLAGKISSESCKRNQFQ